MKKSSLFLCCIAAVSQVDAGGYRVSTQGQKALGMGHTGVAMGESAETVFFNPAAMTNLGSGTEVVGGLTAVYSKNLYQNEDTRSTANTDNGIGTPVNLYIAHKFNPKFSAGFGLYTPFGSNVEWDRDWAGSHLINSIDLASIFLQPTVAYKVNETFSLGLGPIVTVSSVELNRNLSTSLQDENGNRSNVTLEDSGIVDYGYSLGAFFRLSDKLNYGIQYRSEIIVRSEGDADFENLPTALAGVFVDGGYTAELPLPAELTIGFAYQYNPSTKIAFDYNYTFWDAYDDLTIQFDSVTDPNSATSNNPRNYKNSSIFRLGIQHQRSDKLELRGGIYYDESPIRDGYFAPETPRGDSIGFTTGMTYAFTPKFELDLSALYLYFGEEDNSYDFNSEGRFEGSYKVSGWALGFGLTYIF